MAFPRIRLNTRIFPPRRVAFIMLLMVTLTTLPYVVALVSAPNGTHFSGAILDPVDYQSHLTRMRAGLHGTWLYQLGFTSEPHQPLLLQTFYVALGHIARVTGLPLDAVYYLARMILTVLMVWALWAFLSHYLPGQSAWWALLLCLFGGGLGFLLLFIPGATSQVLPIEFWLLDAYIFLGAFAFPHFAAAISLLAIGFLALDTWTTESRHLLVLFLASLAIALIEPFDVALLDGALLVVCTWRVLRGQMPLGRALAGIALIGTSHAAIALYDWIGLTYLPIWQSFLAQNITLSPPVIFYLFGYSPALWTALGGIVLAIRCRDSRWLVPVVWLVEVMLLVYAPVVTQRRFTMGVYTPLAALSVYWLGESAIPWLRARLRRYRLGLMLYGAAATISTVTLILWLLAATQSRANNDLYVHEDTWAAWNWLSTHTPEDSVVLSSFESGSMIAGHSGRRVVIGHWIETAHFADKRLMTQRFFGTDTDDTWRQQVLRAQDVSYLWYSDKEKALGSWSPAQAGYLQPVFKSPDVVIFQVESNPGNADHPGL